MPRKTSNATCREELASLRSEVEKYAALARRYIEARNSGNETEAEALLTELLRAILGGDQA